jgi:hypothetical protein
VPTDRERQRQLDAAEAATRARRDAQTSSQGKGRPDDGDTDPGFRDVGLIDPRDPGNPRTKRGPIDVNVVGNSSVMHALQTLVHNTGGYNRGQRSPGQEDRAGGAGINSDRAMAAAAQQITHEMQLSVDAAERLVRLQTVHAEVMDKAHAAEHDAVVELTRVVSDTSRAVREANARAEAGAPTGDQTSGMGPNPQRPAGAPPTAPPGGPFAWPGDFGGKRSHYDPGGLLGDGPIHGGARNSYFDMMSHIAGGGDPSTFNPRDYAQSGRNHPTTHGELKRNLRIRAARYLDQSFGEPTIPTLDAQYDEQGNLSHYRHDRKDGSEPEDVQPGPDADSIASTIAHGFAGAKLASKAAGGLAAGGASGALRAVPGLGWAYAVGTAVNEGAEWITEQRAANARYQAIEGGGNFSTGVSERLNRFGVRMRERFSGGMTGEQSDQVFDALTQQGFHGSRRAGYTREISQQYKQFGMDPMQSAELITEAANHANGGLLNMAESIRNVTDTAIKYGISAEQARGQLTKNLQEVEASGLYGGAAMALAGGETASNLSMGRSMQGVSFTGMHDELGTRVMAAQQGMGYGEFVGRRQRDPVFGAQAQDQFLTTRTRQYTSGANGEVMNRIIEELGGREAVKNDPEKQRELARRMQEEGNMDFSSLARTLEGMGIEGVSADDPTSAGVVAVQEELHGGRWKTTETERSQAEVTSRDVNDNDTHLYTDSRSFAEEIGDNIENWWDNPLGITAPETAESVNEEVERETGRVDPYIDQLIDPAQGLSTDKNVGVKVKTKDGEKVVPLNTALREYRDQIADGSAKIVGGDKDGRSVKEIMGGRTAEGYRHEGPASAGEDASGDAQDEEEWREDHPYEGSDSGGDSGGSTKVTVEPGPELRNWFRFNTGSGGDTEEGAEGGAPTSPRGLPTGRDGTPSG